MERRSTLLSANLAVAAPVGIEVVETPTAEAMLREALAHADADLVLMSAAVADYRPAEASTAKRPKSAEPWTSSSSRPRTSSRPWPPGARTAR